MKKVVMILLSVILLVSCAKQTTITTEQTDSYTESLMETIGDTEPSVAPTETTDATEPSTEATEPSVEATEPTEAPTEPVIDPELYREADIANSGALHKGKQTVIGEYATIEEAFSDYTIQSMGCGEHDWNHFWEKYQEEQPVGHKEAFYLDDRTDVGFLVEVVDPDGDGIKEVMIDELYAFNKLYDENYAAYLRRDIFYGESRRSIYATNEMVLRVGQVGVSFIYGDTYYSLTRIGLDNPFDYTGYVRDGVVRYSRGLREVTAMQSLYDWGVEHWYPGYGDELAAESGTVTLENGELIFTPDETYTIEEWLLEKFHVKGDLEKTGYDSLDEYMDAYLYGELNPFKKS